MATKNKVLQAVVSFAGTINPSLGKALDDVAGKLDGVNWKAVTAGAAVGGIAVATGKAVIKAGEYLANLGDDYNKAVNQISASTGATNAELDALSESMENIYAQNLGDDFNDVAEGLAATQKASDLAGEALEQATAAGFVLRDTFSYDISESARAASALMKNFDISAEEAYGLIATGAQNGADKNGDLLDTLNEYSGQFAALGLSADQFMGALVEGADAGLFSIDKVADAVKEFNIRAKDGSDSSRDAFNSLGLNADTMFAAFAAGGDTAQAAFFDAVEALNNLDDPLKRNQLGVALFGTQFEDLEAGVLPVLADIETAAYDGAAALQQINDVKYNDLGSAFEGIKRSIEVALLPMASSLAARLMELAPLLPAAFENIGPILTALLPVVAGLTGAFAAYRAIAIATAAAEAVKTAVLAAGATTVTATTVATWALNAAMAVLTSPITLIVAAIGALIAIGVLLWQNWDVIKEKAAELWNTITKIFGKIGDAISGAFDAAKDTIAGVFDWIGDKMSWLYDKITGIPILGDLVSGVTGLFSGENNGTVPGYAAGGFTSGPAIAGEDPRYPTEAIISFNPAYREQNLSYWARAGRMLGISNDDSYEPISTGSGTSVVYDLSGLSFAPQIKIQGDTDEDALIRKLRELEPEFIDFVLEALARREDGAYVTADSRVY